MLALRAAVMAALFFATILLIGFVSAVKDGTRSTELALTRPQDRSYAQSGMNALVHSVARSIPHLRAEQNEADPRRSWSGEIAPNIALDFAGYRFCNYRRAVDPFFALAIVGTESFNRPALMRRIDRALHRFEGEALGSTRSLGPMQMQVANIHALVSAEVPNNADGWLTRAIIDGIEDQPCDYLDLVGRYLDAEADIRAGDVTWEAYRTRLANYYNTGKTDDYRPRLYADVVRAVHDYLSGQDRRGVFDSEFFTLSKTEFYLTRYDVSLWREEGQAVRHMLGESCLGGGKAPRLVVHPKLSFGSETVRAVAARTEALRNQRRLDQIYGDLTWMEDGPLFFDILNRMERAYDAAWAERRANDRLKRITPAPPKPRAPGSAPAEAEPGLDFSEARMLVLCTKPDYR